MPAPTIVWFRQDLRLTDHLPMVEAARRGGPVLPVYLWCPEEEGGWPPGSACRWWLHRSLRSLDESLRRLGSRLILRVGPAADTLKELAREVGADSVLWSHRYEPAAMQQEERVTGALMLQGVQGKGLPGALLFSPGEVLTRSGGPFQVFTPFWRACLSRNPPAAPLPAPAQLAPPAHCPASLSLEALQLEPRVDWAGGLRANWEPGEQGAQLQLARFLAERASEYGAQRDRPDVNGSSQLSPYLRHGELSPRQVWHALSRSDGVSPGDLPFLRQIGWREFAAQLLVHYPQTPERPLRPQFAAFPWLEVKDGLPEWRQGRTGYPLVDAGMRQLWSTGWMHNRVRMVVASFLVKDLLLSWAEGARWFWDTLVDADLANNTFGWQWAAGCGADAAPYFRIFNPTTQAEKFDPHGDYIRRWLPELAGLPAALIHRPWSASGRELAAAGVELGHDYPRPIIDHGYARERALAALTGLKSQSME
ncbi:MAG: cryptochrome/photolyase family protein [Actinomycetota bacterium]